MRWVLVLIALTGCGDDDGAGVGVDAGGSSADAAATPVDAGVLDPATCSVGPADGCCPVAQRWGGSDPDCPSLGCDQLVGSDEIVLSDWGEHAGTGLAWTGTELALAWSGFPGRTSRTIVFERRTPAGLTYGPEERADPFLGGGDAHAGAELAFHPATGGYYFASDGPEVVGGTQRFGVALDGDGVPGEAAQLGLTCNGFAFAQQVFPSPDRILVAQSSWSCDGLLERTARVDLVGLDGAHQATARPLDDLGATSISAAYQPAGDRVLFAFEDSNGLALRSLELEALTWTEPTFLRAEYVDETAVALNGDQIAIVYGRRYDDQAPQLVLWSAGDPPPSPVDLPIPLPANTLVPPRLLWTGAGWIALITAFPADGSALPDSFGDFATWVFHLDPQGGVRESFRLDDGPAYAVNAVWAGGRIAVTWITTDGSDERRLLRWFGCPESAERFARPSTFARGARATLAGRARRRPPR